MNFVDVMIPNGKSSTKRGNLCRMRVKLCIVMIKSRESYSLREGIKYKEKIDWLLIRGFGRTFNQHSIGHNGQRLILKIFSKISKSSINHQNLNTRDPI